MHDQLEVARHRLRPVMKSASKEQLDKLAQELVDFQSVEVAPGICISLT